MIRADADGRSRPETWHLSGRRLLLALAGTLAAAGAAGGIAYATGAIANDSGGVVVACAKTPNGELRLVADASKCKKNEQAVQLQAPVTPAPTSFAVD